MPNRATQCPAGPRRRSAKQLFCGLALAGLMMIGLGAGSASAAPTTMVNLGQASTYGVFSGASVGNTVSAPGAPHTTVRGDLGVKANAQPLGFPPGVVTGVMRIGSGADQAHADIISAYVDMATRTGGAPLAGALAGVTVLPGLHTISAAASNIGTLTLDGGGNPNAVFVFQVNGALAFAAASQVVLTNGARASRVFWQVNGAGSVGAGGSFAGTMIAMDAVGMGAGTLVNGRVFARNGAITLDNNQIFSSPPSFAIDGGAIAYTTDTTPTISGTTDLEAPGLVTVTIAGQTLTATPSAGVWSVTSAILPNGNYQVFASATDAVGNPASETQLMTVDTEPPEIAIDGDPQQATNDDRPVISGTSDVAPGTIVRVAVGSQDLQALVHAGGWWNVRPSSLADGTYEVTAAVTDLAGNESTDSISISVATTAPTFTITGGATALTNDSTPEISGTAGVPEGVLVTLDIANETLTATVTGDGTWSVSASQLTNGPHRVVASVTDASGNRSAFTQMLTVDTVRPLIGINGGSTHATNAPRPTISGTSNAAAGTTVTVKVAGQVMTTLLQSGGSWNVTPARLGDGTWSIRATIADPAGNEGVAVQRLSKDSTKPQTKITKSPKKVGNSRSATYKFTSSEPGSRFTCKLDNRLWKSCVSGSKWSISRGAHKFKVRAIDQAGNVDSSPASHRFRVK